MYVCMCVCLYVCTYVSMHAYMYEYMYIYIVYMCTLIHADTNVQTHPHTCAQVRILAEATRDADAVRAALQDLEDHWSPPAGFNS